MKKQKPPVYSRASNFFIILIFGVLFGTALSLWMTSSLNTGGFNLLSTDTWLFLLLWFLLATLLHEFGHMFFGFVTGYKFVYFKLLGVIIYKKDGKWQTSKDPRRGLGQCIMKPDFAFSDKMPYILYNVGGCLLNFFTAVFCLVLMFIYPQNPFVVSGVIVNVIFGIINIVPFKRWQNDGYNVISIGKTKNIKRAYWLELNIVADTLQGKSFSELPSHYFEFETVDLHDPNVCSALYLQYCYLVSTWQTEKATQLIQQLFEQKHLMPLSNANTIEVEYFNNVILFGDNKTKGINIYNNMSQSVKNAIQRVPIPFAIVAKLLVNGLSAHNDTQFDLDCMVMQKLIEMSKNMAEREYANIIFRLAKQKYGEVFEEPFDI